MRLANLTFVLALAPGLVWAGGGAKIQRKAVGVDGKAVPDAELLNCQGILELRARSGPPAGNPLPSRAGAAEDRREAMGLDGKAVPRSVFLGCGGVREILAKAGPAPGVAGAGAPTPPVSVDLDGWSLGAGAGPEAMDPEGLWEADVESTATPPNSPQYLPAPALKPVRTRPPHPPHLSLEPILEDETLPGTLEHKGSIAMSPTGGPDDLNHLPALETDPYGFPTQPHPSDCVPIAQFTPATRGYPVSNTTRALQILELAEARHKADEITYVHSARDQQWVHKLNLLRRTRIPLRPGDTLTLFRHAPPTDRNFLSHGYLVKDPRSGEPIQYHNHPFLPAGPEDLEAWAQLTGQASESS